MCQRVLIPSRSSGDYRGSETGFILRFEEDMQRILGNSEFALPFWDWTADAKLPDPEQSLIWKADIMGGKGSPVTTGPLIRRNWILADGTYLEREFATDGITLPSQNDVDFALSQRVYDSSPWNHQSPTGFRNVLEGWINIPDSVAPNLHNRVHVWIGGSMSPMTSPNDPVFFLHHSNIDRLWSIWQDKNPKELDIRTTTYPRSRMLQGHNLNDYMTPWDRGRDLIRPADVLDYRELGYSYEVVDTESQPMTVRSGAHCESTSYMWRWDN